MTHRLLALGSAVVFVTCTSAATDSPPVRPGIDVLLADSAHLLRGRRVALLTNQTGVDRAGTGDLTRLLDAGAQVTAILAPEHGYRGVLDQELIAHGRDSATGVRIWSLYGGTRVPTAEMLADVDVIVADLQDIGGRPYTYISTVLEAMRAARAHDVAVIVLDRPNPIGGVAVQGPVLDTVARSFIGMLPVAQRHGMTLGELAHFGNDALEIAADLTVIPVSGWRRDQWFDATGLPWIRPSPNMPNLESATHYPGTVLFEATNLSVGRGTPLAFRVIGAPWLDAARVSGQLGGLRGVVLDDTVVTPERPPDGKFDGVAIRAVRLTVSDRAAYDPARTAVALLIALVRAHPDSVRLVAHRFDRLAGGAALREAVERGETVETIAARWERDLHRFGVHRKRYLIY